MRIHLRSHTHTEKEGDGNVFPNSDPNSRFLRFSQNFETVTSTPLSTVRGTERETRERERRERERREGGGREERGERREKRERENHGSTLPFLYSLQRVESFYFVLACPGRQASEFQYTIDTLHYTRHVH